MARDDEPGTGPKSLPIEWIDGSSGDVVSTERMVRVPSAKDQETYGHGKRLCGECKHFSFKHGQAEMERTRFLRELVLEHQWKIQHLGSKPGTMGLCKMRDSTLTSPYAKECDHFCEAGRGDFRDR